MPAKHLQVNGLDPRTRVNAELVGEPGAQQVMRGERVRLPPASGQRPHQQGGQLFVQRVLRGQGGQFRDMRRGPSRLDLRGDVADLGI